MTGLKVPNFLNTFKVGYTIITVLLTGILIFIKVIVMHSFKDSQHYPIYNSSGVGCATCSTLLHLVVLCVFAVFVYDKTSFRLEDDSKLNAPLCHRALLFKNTMMSPACVLCDNVLHCDVNGHCILSQSFAAKK